MPAELIFSDKWVLMVFSASSSCDCLPRHTFSFLHYEVSVLRFKPFVYLFIFLAWHLSFHRGCLPNREGCAHMQSVYGGGRLKAIIIYPWMQRDNGGSVKTFSQKAAWWMAAKYKCSSFRSALKPDALGDRHCRRRQRDKDAAEFYIRTDTKG